MLYMTILKGDRADAARPIMAISDQELIKSILGKWLRQFEQEPSATHHKHSARKEARRASNP